MGGSDLYEIPIEKLTKVGQNRRDSSSNTKKRRRSSGSTSNEIDKRKRVSSPSSSSLSNELFDIKNIEESVVQNSGLDLSRLTQLFQLFDLQPTTQVAETLVRCLIPQQPRSVPVGVITNLLGGFAKLRVDIQELILQWILAMLSFSGFSDPSELRKFYHLFLHYLPEDKLRPWLCELLYRLTTKENIQTSTINRL
jgi:hypothetical protein